jgi:hypothetical protein
MNVFKYIDDLIDNIYLFIFFSNLINELFTLKAE